jgi:hypothetical protein
MLFPPMDLGRVIVITRRVTTIPIQVTECICRVIVIYLWVTECIWRVITIYLRVTECIWRVIVITRRVIAIPIPSS